MRITTVHGSIEAPTAPAYPTAPPEDAKVLADLTQHDRDRYHRGELKIGTMVRRRAGEYSQKCAVKGLNPLVVVLEKDF